MTPSIFILEHDNAFEYSQQQKELELSLFSSDEMEIIYFILKSRRHVPHRSKFVTSRLTVRAVSPSI